MGPIVIRVNSAARPRTRPGFTLIELLVVIAIISLLISLLMPALASSRKSGQAIVCASNERQLAIAATAYVNDNDDWMNPLEDMYHPNGVEVEATYRVLIYTYTGGTPKVYDCPSEGKQVYSDGLSPTDIAYGGITPDPGENLSQLFGIFHPLERYNSSGIGIGGAHWIRVHDPDAESKKSSMPFGRAKESGYFEGLERMARVAMSDRLIWFGDGGSGSPDLWEDDSFWIKRTTEDFLAPGFNRAAEDDYGARRHRNKANYAFADGHSELLDANDIPCSESECWWSVKFNWHKSNPVH
ncbi:MAG TPA: type II secretion system protein [Phycisphaerae bacterium]|nr:type II secretion system protein [Phycisphaerae bacterium]